MKRLALAAVLAALTLAAPAFAAGKNPPESCGAGSAVSEVTQLVGGLGKFAHDLGFANVGNQVIQVFHGVVQATCHG
jgi:hypothetical protein